MKTEIHSEWLEADGLGGFASGTSTGIRTRRYQALLLTAATPPTGRVVLGNGFDAWVETANGTFPLTSQWYLQPLLDHLEDVGLGHISEIAEAEAPYTPRGCPWQAWSVSEALRLDRVILAEPGKSIRPVKPARKSAPAPALATAQTQQNSLNE